MFEHPEGVLRFEYHPEHILCLFDYLPEARRSSELVHVLVREDRGLIHAQDADHGFLLFRIAADVLIR